MSDSENHSSLQVSVKYKYHKCWLLSTLYFTVPLKLIGIAEIIAENGVYGQTTFRIDLF